MNNNYKKVFEYYCKIDEGADPVYDINEIQYGDMIFEDNNEWTRIESLCDDEFCEEVLLELSHNDKLVYIFIDEDNLNCQLVVINNNVIIRKFYNYKDTPDLNENIGKLNMEDEVPITCWQDMDYILNVLKENPNKLFDI